MTLPLKSSMKQRLEHEAASFTEAKDFSSIAIILHLVVAVLPRESASAEAIKSMLLSYNQISFHYVCPPLNKVAIIAKQEGYGPIDFPALVTPGHTCHSWVLVTTGHTCPTWSP